MSAYRHMEFVTQVVEDVVKAHLPKAASKKPPSLFATTELVVNRLTSQEPPLCRECQHPVDSVAVWLGEMSDEVVVAAWCHGELSKRAIQGRTLRIAMVHGKGEFIDAVQRVACAPWFWPLPPPGPEVP